MRIYLKPLLWNPHPSQVFPFLFKSNFGMMKRGSMKIMAEMISIQNLLNKDISSYKQSKLHTGMLLVKQINSFRDFSLVSLIETEWNIHFLEFFVQKNTERWRVMSGVQICVCIRAHESQILWQKQFGDTAKKL